MLTGRPHFRPLRGIAYTARMKKKRLSIWTLLFLFTASFLLSVIIYGMATNDLSPRYGLFLLLDERTLPVDAAAGVSAELKLKDLQHDPRLVVETRRLPQSTPLTLWLVDITGRQKPLPLRSRVEVDPQGKARADIRLPKNSIRRYGNVVGEQDGQTVFQAPLG